MNRRIITIYVNIFIFIIFSISTIYACTTFVIHQRNHLVFGRNLDWPTGTGLVMVNQRNIQKVALVDSGHTPVLLILLIPSLIWAPLSSLIVPSISLSL